MGEREIFLVLGAMLFFTMTSLSVNNFCLHNNETMMKSEFDYLGISLAQQMIEQIKTRIFDANLSDPPNNFEPPWKLTSAPSDPYGNQANSTDYNEMDDFDDFDKDLPIEIRSNGQQMYFNVKINVYYVDDSNPDVYVNYRTFYKKVTVTISNDYMTHDVVLCHVYSYYDF